jgi:tetratricopeptide (TPR) repeat protein
MSRAAVALVLLAALPWPLDKLVPDWVDRALYNPRERSEVARQAYAEEDWDAAVDAADTALALGPPGPPAPQPDGEAANQAETVDAQRLPDPRLAYNAGTAHLAAGDEDRAVDLLDQAVQGADDAFAPGAFYNLGNARLAAGDAAGAVEAYKETLRRTPDDAAAKHNLEVALERLEEQMKNPFSQPRESPQGDREGEQEESDQGGSQAQSEGPQEESQASDPGENPQAGDPQAEPQPGERRPDDANGDARPDALPRFQDQPDMTAEQAAALLEAVENLERRQRQEAAAERARRSSRGGKDW